MKLTTWRYTYPPDPHVPRWAVGYGTAIRTVLMAWTPWGFGSVTIRRVTRTGSKLKVFRP